MTMKFAITIVIIWSALFTLSAVSADDVEGRTAPYFRSRAFNAPILAGWENQSTDDIAQFHHAEALATIRTAIVGAGDAIAAAEAELSALTSLQVPQPVYSDKVNLAAGTWSVLVYYLDAQTTASLMAREDDGRAVVISFVERDPTARTVMLTAAQADDSLADATPEIAIAVEAIAGMTLSDLIRAESARLPSGDWTVYAGEDLTAMGMVFGNDSFLALREGESGDLAALADAYNRTLLGFFITPDNSLYLGLALAVVFIVLGMLVGSLLWRSRSLRKDLALLQELVREDE